MVPRNRKEGERNGEDYKRDEKNKNVPAVIFYSTAIRALLLTLTWTK